MKKKQEMQGIVENLDNQLHKVKIRIRGLQEGLEGKTWGFFEVFFL